METTTSTSLLMRLRESHDDDAWSRFVELYTPLLYYWARNTGGLQKADASDLVQDVLSLLVKKLPDFEYDSSKSFRGWLRRVTINKWNERARRGSLATIEASDSELANVPDPQSDQDFWESKYRNQLVVNAMAAMKTEFQPNTWSACQEYLTSGRSADEIAVNHGISVWTVYSAKSRLIRRLREELDGMLD